MALYRQGKAAMDANGIVTGTGTNWQSALTLIRPGATILFLSSPIQMAVVNKVVSDTQINAITTNGAVVPSSDYAILLSDSLTVDGLAQDVAETLRYYQSQETVIAEAVDFFKDFDLQSLKDLADQVKADAQASATNAAAAEAAKNAAASSQAAAALSQAAAADSQSGAEAVRDEIQQIIDDSGEQSTLVVLAQPDGASKVGVKQPFSGATNRTQSAKNQDFVSISDFGAVIGQDSTTALVNAISSGKSVYIPDGNYLISNTTISGKDNVNIFGPGTISLTGLSGLTFSSCNYLSLKEINVVCGGPGSTGIKLVSCSNFEIRELKISSHGVGGGLRCESSYAGRIVNNRFYNAATDNTFGASTSCDVNLWGSNGEIIISGNEMKSGGGYGVQARAHSPGDDCYGISILGNVIDGYNSYGVNLYRNKQSATDTQVMRNMIVANNIIRNITGSRPATPGGNDKTFGCAVYIQGAEYTKVIGNDIYDVCSGTNNDLLAPAGVGVTNCGNYQIVSNTIKKSGYYGIKVNDSVLNADNSVGIGDKNGRGLILGNIIEDVNLDGVMVQDRNNVEISSNSIVTSRRGGIRVNTSPSSTVFPVTSNKTIKQNNIINTTGTAIFVGYSKNFSIDGNKINTCDQGVSIGSSSFGTLKDNSISNATTRAVNLSANNTVAGSITVSGTYVENSPVGILVEHPVNYLDNPLATPSGTYAEFRAITADSPNVWGVSFANVNPSSAINITNFVGGKIGQGITLWMNNGNTTFVDSSSLILKGRTNYNPTSNVVISFIKTKAGWIETSRSA